MYEYARTIEVPSKLDDEIARITLSRFNEAVMWQRTERIGDKSLREVMSDCYNQVHGILDCHDREVVEELGVSAYVNLTAMKTGIVKSYLLENLVQSDELPWIIKPTPIPALSDRGRMMALNRIREQVFGQDFSGDLEALATEITDRLMEEERTLASESSERMYNLIKDQCAEGRWNDSMYGVVSNFVDYPFGVIHGPVPVRRPRLAWAGNNVRVKPEKFYEFKEVSPWDFWYSPDSPDTQRGTGIFIRQRWTRQNLLQAAQIRSYKYDVIEEILRATTRNDYMFKWLSENPEQPSDMTLRWNNCSATIDVLIHYGFFSGRELQNFGLTGVDAIQYYNATVTVINGKTVQVVLPPNPNVNQRPVYTASFYKDGDRIPGSGIPQRIRDVERCFITSLRYLMANAAISYGPIVEGDFNRLSKYMTQEDMARLIPNVMYLSDSELGQNNPALRFYTQPNVMAQFLRVAEFYMDLGDRVTNIPAALHGTAQGTGVNRTFRGALMLQNNSTKAINAAVYNMDKSMFAPIGEQMYNYNMLYEDDETIKGDCLVVAQGAVGLLQKEIDRQNAYEIMQLTAAAGNQLAALPNGGALVTWALENSFERAGVPKQVLTDAFGPGAESMPSPVDTGVQGMDNQIPLGGE